MRASIARAMGLSKVQSPKSKVQSLLSPTLDFGLWTLDSSIVRADAPEGIDLDRYPDDEQQRHYGEQQIRAVSLNRDAANAGQVRQLRLWQRRGEVPCAPL